MDTVLDDYRPLTWVPGSATIGGALTGSYQNVQANAGTDSLVFGPGIARSDIVMQRSGNDLIVGVKDPAHPGVPFAQLDKITLQNWADVNDRIEFFRFADGNTLDLSGGDAALAAFLVPSGETLSRTSVAENTAIGTVVGNGFDRRPRCQRDPDLLAVRLRLWPLRGQRIHRRDHRRRRAEF
jgi:hypothetical protein